MEFGITLEKEPTEAVKALTSSNIDKLVTPVDTQFKFYEKRSIFEEHPVFLQVLKMVNSYFVWVGTVPPIMSSLLLSVPHAQSVDPITTSLLGNKADSAGPSIAAKLGKKTNASILVSYNLSETIPGIKEYVEQQIFEAVKSLSTEA